MNEIITGMTAAEYRKQVRHKYGAKQTVRDGAARNKTEEAFWQMQLIRKRTGEIEDCQWEPFNLRLAQNTWYRPDCLVVENDGTMTVMEVKGTFFRDDARVKVKVAARQHYYFSFVVAVGKKEGSEYTWTYEEIPT